MIRRTLGIIGTGALGGSIGMRSRVNGLRVIGYDSDISALRQALALQAIDASVDREQLCNEAEIIVLAAPIDATLAEITAMVSNPPAAKLIIDIASVKSPIVKAAKSLKQFVGTHPMAGTERSGLRSAGASLFESCRWAFVRSESRSLDTAVCEFIRSFDAEPFAIDAETHDQVVALTSHLPQLFSTVFSALLADKSAAVAYENLLGPAAREFRRLGNSPLAMWDPIFRHNAQNIANEARRLSHALTYIAEASVHGDAVPLHEAFLQAAAR
ncbi:MAG: prephenate dehydrogenase [Candidatus Eremiobacteraeota bacterium]|nr:prephenate dehydrogenase [Candidatus Eremiobacteraeota bacterium]